MSPSKNPPAAVAIKDVCHFLEGFAPARLAEEWDNVGLLLGDAAQPARRIMTCLTVTPESVAEAIAGKVDLIVAHHPLPFRPLKRITTDNTAAALLWNLARAGIAIYSPHTAFDSAAAGINAELATKFGINDARPLLPLAGDVDGLGAGRCGRLATETTVAGLIEIVKTEFSRSESSLSGIALVGQPQQAVSKIAFACGSGGTFLSAAKRLGCQALVTGEATFHTCLEAKANGIALILLGHFASERFAVENLAARISQWRAAYAGDEADSEVAIWASRDETDPVTRVTF